LPVTFTEYFVQVNTPGAWEVVVPVGATVNGVITDPLTGNALLKREILHKKSTNKANDIKRYDLALLNVSEILTRAKTIKFKPISRNHLTAF
jgi:hypothetical protein